MGERRPGGKPAGAPLTAGAVTVRSRLPPFLLSIPPPLPREKLPPETRRASARGRATTRTHLQLHPRRTAPHRAAANPPVGWRSRFRCCYNCAGRQGTSKKYSRPASPPTGPERQTQHGLPPPPPPSPPPAPRPPLRPPSLGSV